MQCDQFIGNGYPALQHSSSNPGGPPRLVTVGQELPQTLSTPRPRRKRRKKAPKEDSHTASRTLGLINKNITTHSKFSSFKENKEAANEEGGLALPLTLDGREGIRACWFPRSIFHLIHCPPMLTFSYRDVGDHFSCAY